MALLLSLAGPATASSLRNARWQFRLLPGDSLAKAHPDAAQWHAAQVPGSVHTDLLANRLIVAPYRGAHEAQLQWIGRATWEYRAHFDVGPETLARRHSVLVFEGLDTFAKVSLNGLPILSANNAHRRWRVNVEGLLKAKDNVLQIVFQSPIDKLLARVLAMPYKIAGNYPSPYDDIPGDVMIGNFVRKPAYHFGWDWGPRYVTAGIWRPIVLQTWNDRRIVDLAVRTNKLNAEQAALTVLLTVRQSARPTSVNVNVALYGPEGHTAAHQKKRATLTKGENRLAVPVSLEHPKRWWPNGYGKQNRYTVVATVRGANGQALESKQQFGLRTVKIRQRKDAKGDGRGFAFVINGVAVFAKGANVIPFDMFPARVTKKRLQRVMQAAADSHMNMLRVWGGGYYPSDAFYQLADQLGLMIWQDFMFGGGMQPAYDPDFRANVVAEAHDNILRLRHHPSLVLWSGNNEEESAWKNWGHGAKLKKMAPQFAAKVWKGYQRLFGHDLRQAVAQWGLGTPYWASSPSNDLQGNPDASNRGDKHYWGVWAQKKPIQAYLHETPRFMSEYGLQAWPSLKTVREFASPEQWAVDNPVIRAHQKYLAGDGNQRLLYYIEAEYGAPDSFADFVYLSQVMQAEGISLAALHHRASRPYTMGSLYWQLNDVWPGASWSSIDYDGRWKALQFHARRFFAPVAIAALRDRNAATTRVTLLNDHNRAVKAHWRVRVMDFDGTEHTTQTHDVTLAPLSATRVASFSDASLRGDADPRHTVAVFDLMINGERVSRRLVYFVPAKNQALKANPVAAEIRTQGDAFVLTLTAHSLVRDLWIDFDHVQARLEDNAINLLAGQTRQLIIHSPASLRQLRKALRLKSLGDVR